MIEVSANGAPVSAYGTIEAMILHGFFSGCSTETLTPGTVLVLLVNGAEVLREVVPEPQDDEDEGGGA